MIRAILGCLLLASAAVGCVSTLEHQPRDFELEEPWPRVVGRGPVAVRAGPAPAGWRAIRLPGQVFKLDLQDYTRSLVQRVEEGLGSQQVEVRSDAGRWLELEVVHASILPGSGRFHCVIDFSARTGDGAVAGLQAREHSWRVDKACNAALSRAAQACLAEPLVRAYLEAP